MSEHVHRLRAKRRLAEFTRPASSKDRGLYTVLGLFLGFFGAHNFYAERLGPACGQLGLGIVNAALLLNGSGLGFVTAGVLLLWVLWDIVTFS